MEKMGPFKMPTFKEIEKKCEELRINLSNSNFKPNSIAGYNLVNELQLLAPESLGKRFDPFYITFLLLAETQAELSELVDQFARLRAEREQSNFELEPSFFWSNEWSRSEDDLMAGPVSSTPKRTSDGGDFRSFPIPSADETVLLAGKEQEENSSYGCLIGLLFFVLLLFVILLDGLIVFAKL